MWLCLQSASGQRGGTFSESACYRGTNESLWYQDTRLYLEKKSDGQEVLHLSIGMRFRKGARHSARSLNMENIPTIVFYEHDDPVRSIITYFISLALADNAFRTVRTIDDIINTKIPPGQDIWVFEWKSSIGEMPVFQEVNDKGPTGKSMTYSMIKSLIVKLGHRAGYTENITMHQQDMTAFRSSLINEVRDCILGCINPQTALLTSIFRIQADHSERLNRQTVIFSIDGTETESESEYASTEDLFFDCLSRLAEQKSIEAIESLSRSFSRPADYFFEKGSNFYPEQYSHNSHLQDCMIYAINPRKWQRVHLHAASETYTDSLATFGTSVIRGAVQRDKPPRTLSNIPWRELKRMVFISSFNT